MVSELHSAVAPPKQDNLVALAIRICAEHEAVGHAVRDMLAHAMAAGDALIEAHKAIPHGKWESWLRQDCGLNIRTAVRYVQLAKARPLFESSNPSQTTDLTIEGALRLLGNGRRSKPNKRAKALSGLSSDDWDNANLEQRRNFLSDVGLLPILASMPPSWRSEIERRIVGQHASAAAPASALAAKVTLSLRLALSTTKPGEASAALAAIRRLLERNGHDLHNLVIAIETAAAKRAA